MNSGVMTVTDGALITFDVCGRETQITVRDDAGMKGFSLTLEETLDLCNALQKRVMVVLYAKTDGI